jgi:hypothetical protein
MNDIDLNKRLLQIMSLDENAKNCGCGEEVCITYGKVEEVSDFKKRELEYELRDEEPKKDTRKYTNEPLNRDRDDHAKKLKKLRSMGYDINMDPHAEPNVKIKKEEADKDDDYSMPRSKREKEQAKNSATNEFTPDKVYKAMMKRVKAEESCCDTPEEMMEPEVEGSVEFKQHKNTDKGSVSIEASADNMQELAKVLKLAGLTLPKDMNADQDPIQPEEMPVVDVQDGDAPTMDFPKTDVNPNMSTDKAVLTSVIRDKLRDYLKNSRS